ncbi:MAG TPA: anhydro-N-acetylmuramic acid kinase [Porticoccaceae bacterium]|jgi:anhydro-N-acetylmuramic acid kinase|nr:anhydro-N-acetylmuramic acid kinase [Gammaproteobacteria bacterium]HIL60577.1 anhydro-N-acetylmuramic acid kinase [Porticoccaceae bacterium]
MTNSNFFIGLISGTSIDGIDAVLVQFENDQPKLIATHCGEIDANLRNRILNLCSSTNLDFKSLGETDVIFGRAFAQAAKDLLTSSGVDAQAITAIGSHGQTIFHQPTGEQPFTLQIGDANTIAELTDITTVADFRRRDMVVGGEGAPLAPVMHRNCFSSAEENRVILNIGGISNITVLNQDGSAFAFDTGPGNVLMDYWIDKHKQQAYDVNGDWAKTGNTNQTLLAQLMTEEYLALSHPKSTGRELFSGRWLESQLESRGKEISAEDVQATLLEFTASTITNSINSCSQPNRLFVCGGGAHNTGLMLKLNELLSNCDVTSTAALGFDPDWVEAVAFAWMAKQTMAGKSIDTTTFTGASKATILGGIYQA